MENKGRLRLSLSFSHFARANRSLQFHADFVGVAVDSSVNRNQAQVVLLVNSLLLLLALSQSALSEAEWIHDLCRTTISQGDLKCFGEILGLGSA